MNRRVNFILPANFKRSCFAPGQAVSSCPGYICPGYVLNIQETPRYVHWRLRYGVYPGKSVRMARSKTRCNVMEGKMLHGKNYKQLSIEERTKL